MVKIPALGIEYSNSCNLKDVCKHCYGATGTEGPGLIKLSDKIIDIIIKEAPLIAESITITGGEPTTYPDVVKRIVSGTKLPWTLMTNGVIWRKDFHPFGALVSLDCQDVRPGVNPSEVMHNVLKYNCNLSINTVLSAGVNLFELYDILKKASDRLQKTGKKISEWKLGFVVKKGRASHHPEIFAEWDKIFYHLKEFLRIYFKEQPFPLAIRGGFFTKNISKNDKIPKINLSKNPCLDCFHRTRYMTINVHGRVQMCSAASNKSVPINNSLVDACIKILNSPELTELTYKDWKQCRDCRWFGICGAGCPSLAETYNQGWTGKDIYQCEIMKRIEDILLPVLPDYIQKLFL
jgi:radical SAM protein with 4Fe4S-binding SPASM domain